MWLIPENDHAQTATSNRLLWKLRSSEKSLPVARHEEARFLDIRTSLSILISTFAITARDIQISYSSLSVLRVHKLFALPMSIFPRSVTQQSNLIDPFLFMKDIPNHPWVQDYQGWDCNTTQSEDNRKDMEDAEQRSEWSRKAPMPTSSSGTREREAFQPLRTRLPGPTICRWGASTFQ